MPSMRVSPVMLLRRRSCYSGPLLLLGIGLCLFQILMVARNRLRSGQHDRSRESDMMDEETLRILSHLEAAQIQVHSRPSPLHHRAVVLMGQHLVSDAEVQLYQRVLQQMDFDVQLSRYPETSSFLKTNQGVGGWSLLLCLSSSERSCLRKISFSHLQRHQMVNLLPGLMRAFSDAGGGLCHLFTHSQLTDSRLPMRPDSCGSANQRLQFGADSRPPVGAPPPALIAMVNVYVLVTSVSPLTSFLHDISVVVTKQEQRTTKLRDFLWQQLGSVMSHQALGQVQMVISDVLQAAVSSSESQDHSSRCVWCYQLLTFTLLFSGSITPVIAQVDTDVTHLSEDRVDRQVTRDQILEDSLHFLLSSHRHLSEWEQYSDCRLMHGICLSEDDFLLLLQFERQMKTPSNFQLLYPSSSSSSLGLVSNLLMKISHHYTLQRNHSFRSDATEELTNQDAALSSSQDEAESTCLDPHLRQIYTDPPLTLAPSFRPWVKEYHAEVTFDTVMVRIRVEPISPVCHVHLDEHQGSRIANYSVGLGKSRITILVTDDDGPQPVVMAIYTVHMYRESRPSLPMFGDHVMCSFVQDCGLLVQPGKPCGLEPFSPSQSSHPACSSGHVSGRWVVPCLSCSDNRTCDWREVAWQPDGCYHPLVDRPLLQDCMTNRKVLFIGDSTNRGMMYFLMERVNASLDEWGKAHNTLIYKNLNRGRTLVSYSYYPQFWLQKNQRPTFRQALLQLINRSRPLANSPLTILVVGGVQWLSTSHLWTIREVLNRESLCEILVVVKSLGMGFHLPVDGIRSLSLGEIQELYRQNLNIIDIAKHHGYEVIDTFSITMGRYKEFLQGQCACHFHEVKFSSFMQSDNMTSTTSRTTSNRVGPRLGSQSAKSDTDQEVWPTASTYHVRGPVNQVYSEILLSRLCSKNRD